MSTKTTDQLFYIYNQSVATQQTEESVSEVFEDVPDDLRPLAEALYGLVEASDEEPEAEKSKQDFPLAHH